MGQIKLPVGATTKKTIVGRGASSKGRTCGRGHDGLGQRSGGSSRLGFEGGQMPLYRRVARRGFSNSKFKQEYAAVSLDVLSANFEDGDVITNGEQVMIGGEEKYIALCRKCWKKLTKNTNSNQI